MHPSTWRIVATAAAALTIACGSFALGAAMTSDPPTAAAPRSDGPVASSTPATAADVAAADAAQPSGPSAPAASTPPSGPSAPASSTPAATPQAIKIVDFAFDPVELSVAAGSVVTWTNDDAAVHNVDSGDGVIASPDLEQDGAYEVTLDQPGTIEYQCNIHEYMKGSITVTP